MLKKALAGCLALGLAGLPIPLSAQSVAYDAEVAKGVRQVEDGDYDAAILTLDTASRRLAPNPAKTRDLAQAYLYLGIAYVGKGLEAAAKAKFREAVKQMKDLTLSPDKFPPRVIDLFEAAKDEAAKSASAPGTPAPKKGGSKKPLLIGGGVVVAAGGAFLISKAIGGDDSSSCDTFFQDPSGLLNDRQTSFSLTTTPTQAGSWKAELSWTILSGSSAGAALPLPPTLFLYAVNAASGQDVSQSRLLTPTSSIVEWQGTAGTLYRVGADLQGGGSANFQLAVSGPCF